MARSNVLFQEQQFHSKGANRSALRETENTILITQHFGWEILPKRLQKAYVCYFPTTAPNRAAFIVFSLTQYKLSILAYYIFLLPLLVLESWKNSQAADGRILLPYHHKQIFSLLLYGQLVVSHCTLTITDFVEVFCCCLFLATRFLLIENSSQMKVWKKYIHWRAGLNLAKHDEKVLKEKYKHYVLLNGSCPESIKPQQLRTHFFFQMSCPTILDAESRNQGCNCSRLVMILNEVSDLDYN